MRGRRAPLSPVAIVLTPLSRRTDSICPFCFIGKRRIDEAIRRVKAEGLPLDFSIRFAPFLLDPTLPNSPGVRTFPFLSSSLIADAL